MSTCITYLAAPLAWGHLKWSRLDCLEASIRLAVRCMPGLPIIVFHEDYGNVEFDRLASAVVGSAIDSASRIEFHKVDFSERASDHFLSCRPGERVGTYGYQRMCDFFCGPMQAHAALQPFTHYVRLDDDSYLMRRWTPHELDDIEHYDYTYRSVFDDAHVSLHAATASFLEDRLLRSPRPYSGTAPYTNYHSASLDMWREPLVVAYLNSIRAAGGFMRLGWNDANVQGMIAWNILPVIGGRVKTLKFPYRHNQHCCHEGPHGPLCDDGTVAEHKWGPPRLQDILCV